MSGSTVDCPSPVPATRRLLTGACRAVLAVVFLMAGAAKVTDLPGFADRVVLHTELPQTLAWGVARFLPWLELTCGLCLAVGYAVREAGAILTILLVLFLGYALLHRGEADCGCFVFPRVVPESFAWWPALRNGLLLMCAVRVTACGLAQNAKPQAANPIRT